jgi:hypothetical protein
MYRSTILNESTTFRNQIMRNLRIIWLYCYITRNRMQNQKIKCIDPRFLDLNTSWR